MVKGRRSKRRRSPAASLTDDLVVEILCHLPARSVCRFKCVSTTWRDLISAHNRKLPQTLAGIFTMHDAENMMGSVPHFINVLGRDCPLVSPWFDFLPANQIYLLDCCNGLVLCSYWPTIHDCHLFVCNPATKKWVELPDSNLGNRPRGLCLGFNPTVSPHFYVFEFSHDYDDDFSLLGYGVQVYSSETGQWVRKGDNGISFFAHYYSHVFLNNGCVHYLTNDPAIAVVDTQGKACWSIPVPDNREYGFIQQSQGRLYYANFEADDEDQVVRFVVYVLEDYDNQRWTLKHTAEAFDVLGQESHNLARDFEWVAIHPDCNMIFYTVGWDKTLMSYDMDRRQVHVICTLGQDTREVYLPYVPLFSELQALHM
ncbi:F-box protein At5g07610-like isoform X3 [Miscanthus floridulus]